MQHKKLKIFIIFIILAVLVVFAFLFIKISFIKTDNNIVMPPVNDGEYYMQITHQSGDFFEFTQVSYFTGTEAFATAEREVKCDKKDIADCVSTLKNGYYILPSNPESGFVQSIGDSKIFLAVNNEVSASSKDLIKEINLPGYVSAFKIKVTNGKIETIEELTRYNNSGESGLPKGYVLDDYQVEKVSETACKYDGDCKTPVEYMLKSNCPYMSICLKNRCTVVCPHYPSQTVNQVALTEKEARVIAEKTCINSSESLKKGAYNQYTKTWWFDANLNSSQEGCNPACVVSEETKTAEINWRCTGLRQ
jgi:hypothetical protein